MSRGKTQIFQVIRAIFVIPPPLPFFTIKSKTYPMQGSAKPFTRFVARFWAVRTWCSGAVWHGFEWSFCTTDCRWLEIRVLTAAAAFRRWVEQLTMLASVLCAALGWISACQALEGACDTTDRRRVKQETAHGHVSVLCGYWAR